jgi:YtkA-like
MPAPTRTSLALALLLAPLGCAASDKDDGGSMDDGADDGSSSDDGPALSGCAAETRDDTYTLGMMKQGDHVQVAFVDALPAPPSRGDNTWTVEITNDAGVALSDLGIDVEPYMPDHMHGTSIEAHATATDVAGQYVLEPVNLFMPGLWQVTLYLELPDGPSDSVEFDFCVDP